MNKTLAVLAVVYHEPSWSQTEACIQNNLPPGTDVYYVERNPQGVGNLSQAINHGFTEHGLHTYRFVWIVTNITFDSMVAERLVDVCGHFGWAACHPSFKSDHPFLRPNSHLHGRGNVAVPYIEFTAPLVRGDVFAEHLLDEQMPYVGMDLDWSHRIRRAGMRVGVCRTVQIGHTYIRNHDQLGSQITKQRAELRKAAEGPTEARLVEKYGADWRKKLYYFGAI